MKLKSQVFFFEIDSRGDPLFGFCSGADVIIRPFLRWMITSSRSTVKLKFYTPDILPNFLLAFFKRKHKFFEDVQMKETVYAK